MVVYCGIFIWSIINSQIVKLKDKHNWLYYLLVLIPPVFFATIRYNIGTDYINYWYYFNGGNYYDNTFEPLFRLLNYIAQLLFHDFYGVLLFSAILTYGFVLASLVKLKNELSISIGLWIYYCYYYVASYNVMRQLIAVSIVIYALIILIENHTSQYLLLIVLASMFHISALLAFVPLILKFAGSVDRKIWMIIIYISSIFFVFIGGYIINSFAGIVGEYDVYLSNSYSTVSWEHILDIIPAFLIIAIPIVLYYKYFRIDEKYDLLCITGLFSIVLFILGFYFKWFTRAIYYFDIVQVPIWAINVRRIKLVKNRLIVKCLVSGFYLFYFWYSSVYRGSNACVPYQSILF